MSKTIPTVTKTLPLSTATSSLESSSPASVSGADVCVIIPVYNRAQRLRCALDSIVAQTIAVGQVVVVDDGSTDNPAAVVTRYRHSDLNISCIHCENSGVAAARNIGVMAAQTQFVAFLDSDDWWLPEKLEVQISYWNTLLEQGISPGLIDALAVDEFTGEVGAVSNLVKHGDCYKAMLLTNIVNGTSSVLTTKDAIVAAGGFPEDLRFSEDRYLWLGIAANDELYTVPEILVHLGNGPDNLRNNTDFNLEQKRQYLYKVEHSCELTVAEKNSMWVRSLGDFMLTYARLGKVAKVRQLFAEMTAFGRLTILSQLPVSIVVYFLSLFGRRMLLAAAVVNRRFIKYSPHRSRRQFRHVGNKPEPDSWGK